MAMLRLLARDSGDMALLPAVVVQDELQSGVLQLYAEIPEIAEQFFAVTLQPVSYTHLDVYKRQGRAPSAYPASPQPPPGACRRRS